MSTNNIFIKDMKKKRLGKTLISIEVLKYILTPYWMAHIKVFYLHQKTEDTLEIPQKPILKMAHNVWHVESV